LPIPKLYSEVVDGLIKKTEQGHVNWSPSGDDVCVHLPGFTLELWAGKDDENGHSFVACGIRDRPKTQFTDTWFVEEGDHDYPKLKSLFDRARRKVRGVEKKIDLLKALLKADDMVGDPSDEEDEL
jgi:hypothetical protein